MLVTPTGLPSTVAANSTGSSSAINTLGMTRGAVGLQSTQAGTLTVQRYVDAGGLIPLSTPATAPLVANTPVSVGWSDGLPCGSIIISVANSAGSPATLSLATVLLSP
jgi:hypothetical protein